jgi:hypothetical protein
MAKDKTPDQNKGLKDVFLGALVTGTTRSLASPLFMPAIALELHAQNHYGTTNAMPSYP